MPKSNTSLKKLLHEIRRVSESREVLTDKKIEAIYKTLNQDLNAFLADTYIKYADRDGRMYVSYLDEKRQRAWFMSEIAKNVDNMTPALQKEIMTLVDKTYTECYKGMIEALRTVTTKKEYENIAKDLNVPPEVLKQAVNNNISKLTLPRVLEKNRAEITYQIQQELNIGLINGDRYETMAKRISERLNISKGKAMNITRTETHRNIESGLMDSAELFGSKLGGSDLIYAVTWRTMKDNRVRPLQRRKTATGWKTTRSTNGANHIQMEGVTVKVGELFDLGEGIKTKAPSQSGYAKHDCNCRCFLEYNLLTVEEFANVTDQTPEQVRKKYGMTRKAEATEKPKAETKTVKEDNLTNNGNYSKIEMQMSDYPEAFTKGAEGKNTQKLIDYVNNIEGADPNALKLYASTGKLENITSQGIPFKISHGKNHAVSYTYKSANHQLVEVKYNIPKFKGDNIAGQVNTALHEQMHLLDMYGRTDPKKYNNWFSSTQKPLIEAFRNSNDSIGDEIADLFKKHNAEHDIIRNRLEQEYKKKALEIREKYLPNGKPSWEDYASYKKYEKDAKKLRKELDELRDYESRNIMGGGVGNLQDIYDALSKGTYRANGTVYYGHGQRYYAREGERIKETVANYVSLSVTRPDLVKMLRKDKPELCTELDNLVIELLKKVGS